MAVADLKGYKTLLVNSAIAIIPILDIITNHGDAINALTGGQAAGVISAIGLLNMGLRWVTTTPVMKGE